MTNPESETANKAAERKERDWASNSGYGLIISLDCRCAEEINKARKRRRTKDDLCSREEEGESAEVEETAKGVHDQGSAGILDRPGRREVAGGQVATLRSEFANISSTVLEI